jgi:hypothetical protein
MGVQRRQREQLDVVRLEQRRPGLRSEVKQSSHALLVVYAHIGSEGTGYTHRVAVSLGRGLARREFRRREARGCLGGPSS